MEFLTAEVRRRYVGTDGQVEFATESGPDAGKYRK